MAVTDSTGQHGPWSEELRVTWDGESNLSKKNFHACIIWISIRNAVVNFIVTHYTCHWLILDQEQMKLLIHLLPTTCFQS